MNIKVKTFLATASLLLALSDTQLQASLDPESRKLQKEVIEGTNSSYPLPEALLIAKRKQLKRILEGSVVCRELPDRERLALAVFHHQDASLKGLTLEQLYDGYLYTLPNFHSGFMIERTPKTAALIVNRNSAHLTN